MQLFLYLQVLDFLTTMVGFKFGLQEASPFVRWLLYLGPTTGVLVSKVTAVAVALLCLHLNRPRLVRWANVWYGALIIWNLSLIWIVNTPA